MGWLFVFLSVSAQGALKQTKYLMFCLNIYDGFFLQLRSEMECRMI